MRYTVCLAALAAVFLAPAVHAEQAPRPFSGIHLGIEFGWNNDPFADEPGQEEENAFGGLILGGRYQFGNAVVAGAEATAGFGATTLDTVAAVGGLAFGDGRNLVYGKLGYGAANELFGGLFDDDDEVTGGSGVHLALGYERAVWRFFSLRAQASYTSLDRVEDLATVTAGVLLRF